MIKAVPIILLKFALVGSDQAPLGLRDLKFKSRYVAIFRICIFREIPAFGEAVIVLPQRAELEQSVLNVTQ